MKIKELDAASLSPRELNSQVKESAKDYDKILIKNPNAMHYLVAGVTDEVNIELDGSVGYFTGTMCDGPKIKINGNAGWFVGDNLTDGEVVVEGSAGDGAGQGIYGGTVVVLGDRYAENPLKLDTPVMIGAMSFGALSKEAKMALAIGSSLAGTVTNTGEGGMLPEERELADKLIAQYASGRFGVSADYLKQGDAVEIKIGQGAKSGMGGHLLGEKVTAEVSRIRKIPVGSDALSPARHMDIVGPEDLSMKISQLREITDWKVPIIVKFASGKVASDVKIAAKGGADIIVVDGMQGGTGAGPDVIMEHSGIPSLAAIVEADQALKEINLREDVSLVAAGGIRSGADLAKALALGADAVYIATAALISIGCRVCQMCYKGNCSKGIATQDLSLRHRLDYKEMGKAVANYINAMTDEACMLVQQAGNTHITKLEKQNLRALTMEASALTGVPMAGSENRKN